MQYAGREWAYQYRFFNGLCSESELKILSNRIASHYAKLTKHWDIQQNSEWACRTYFATKMILNATVLLNSCEFARKTGLRSAIPYFEYYATLSMLRCLVYTLPTQSWDEGKLIEITHTKAINLAIDWINNFNKVKAIELKATIFQLKAQRELISYRAPASGDTNLGKDYDLIELLTILAEAAEFNSELLQASINKNADPLMFEVLDEHIHMIANVSIEGYTFSDNEDYYRLGYVQRKTKRPYHLQLFMTEGQTEDFIGAWDGDQDDEEQFSNGSPSDWQAIFDVP